MNVPTEPFRLCLPNLFRHTLRSTHLFQLLLSIEQALATLPTQCQDRLYAPLCAAMQALFTAGNLRRAICHLNTWARWCAYCAAFSVNPTLYELEDCITYMQVYIQQYRTGHLAPRGRPVGARTPEEAIQFVSQTLQKLGLGDKRIGPDTNKINSCLSDMWKHWKKNNPPPLRVKPLPLAVPHKAKEISTKLGGLAMVATARLMWTGLFYLGRPGEYCAARYAAHFSRLKDILVYRHGSMLAHSAPR